MIHDKLSNLISNHFPMFLNAITVLACFFSNKASFSHVRTFEIHISPGMLIPRFVLCQVISIILISNYISNSEAIVAHQIQNALHLHLPAHRIAPTPMSFYCILPFYSIKEFVNSDRTSFMHFCILKFFIIVYLFSIHSCICLYFLHKSVLF